MLFLPPDLSTWGRLSLHLSVSTRLSLSRSLTGSALLSVCLSSEEFQVNQSRFINVTTTFNRDKVHSVTFVTSRLHFVTDWRGNLFGSPSPPSCIRGDQTIESPFGVSGLSRSACTVSLLGPCYPIGLPSQSPKILQRHLGCEFVKLLFTVPFNLRAKVRNC